VGEAVIVNQDRLRYVFLLATSLGGLTILIKGSSDTTFGGSCELVGVVQ
jgi:hypothetical protein